MNTKHIHQCAHKNHTYVHRNLEQPLIQDPDCYGSLATPPFFFPYCFCFGCLWGSFVSGQLQMSIYLLWFNCVVGNFCLKMPVLHILHYNRSHWTTSSSCCPVPGLLFREERFIFLCSSALCLKIHKLTFWWIFVPVLAQMCPHAWLDRARYWHDVMAAEGDFFRAAFCWHPINSALWGFRLSLKRFNKAFALCHLFQGNPERLYVIC